MSRLARLRPAASALQSARAQRTPGRQCPPRIASFLRPCLLLFAHALQHAPWDTSDGGAEESEYFDQCLEYWLAHPSGLPYVPDVIWFNNGMHNVMINGTGTPGQGGNASSYGPFLASATARLVAWASANRVKLLYAWTTPYLNSASQDAIITGLLNPAAAEIMTAAGIPQIDLHKAITDKCGLAPQARCARSRRALARRARQLRCALFLARARMSARALAHGG